MVVDTCHCSYKVAYVGGLWSRLPWAETEDPVMKIIKVKRVDGTTQAVEYFPGTTLVPPKKK
jgi:hypothetical protein